MPWCANLNPNHQVIESYFSGEVSAQEWTSAFYETIRLVRENNTPLIYTDCSALKEGLSLYDIYPILNELGSSEEYRLLKQAILLPISIHLIKSLKFWETTCNNRGYRVKTFVCRQSAFYWLLQKIS